MSNAPKYTGFNFDASQVAPQAPMEPIPSGWYIVAITDGEVKPTADGSGQRFAFELTVQHGEFQNRKIFDGLNLVNTNAEAVRIAHGQLSAICHATGVIRITDMRELFGKPFGAKIALEGARQDENTGKTYESRNTFKGAKKASDVAMPAPGAPRAGGVAPAPSWATGPGAPAPSGPISAPAGFPANPFPVAAPAGAAPTTPAPFAPPANPTPAPARAFMVYTGDANNIPKKLEQEIQGLFATMQPAQLQMVRVAAVLPNGQVDPNWLTLEQAGIKPAQPIPTPSPVGNPVPPPFAGGPAQFPGAAPAQFGAPAGVPGFAPNPAQGFAPPQGGAAPAPFAPAGPGPVAPWGRA